ncbi:MAG: hypothetical protein BWY63_00635 [Chloroflexi bacterium ADurb.Bin360]|nr:MAG: hypothetical protein BWY63_00635 [Chloroflexi bacterium ADurb.Bin360]
MLAQYSLKFRVNLRHAVTCREKGQPIATGKAIEPTQFLAYFFHKVLDFFGTRIGAQITGHPK